MFAVSVVSGSPYELLNSTLTPPADHAFAGWKLSDAGDLLHPGDVINPTENAVLYAQWTYTGTGTDPGNGDGEQNFWFREIAGISYWAILIIAFAAVFVGCIFIRW
jgi:hypothetical protein